MRSIADDLRRESARTVAALSVAERVALALRLGDEDLARYRAVHGTSEQESRAAFSRARAVGRIPSPANGFERR